MTYQARLADMRVALEEDGIEDARLESELLLAKAGGLSRVQLLARLSRPLDAPAARASSELISRRRTREPLFYILGHREFFGRDFCVGPGVLIPRPETETLVEAALQEIAQLSRRLGRDPLVVDVGVGSGAVAISLALELPSLGRMVGTDLSPVALGMARLNAERLGAADRMRLVQADLLSGLSRRPDLIVSNPPYVPTSDIAELAPEIARFEPRAALDGGPDGLDVARRLLEQATACVSRGGTLLMEIGDTQGPAVRAMAITRLPGATVELRADLAGRPRVVRVAHE